MTASLETARVNGITEADGAQTLTQVPDGELWYVDYVEFICDGTGNGNTAAADASICDTDTMSPDNGAAAAYDVNVVIRSSFEGAGRVVIGAYALPGDYIRARVDPDGGATFDIRLQARRVI
jgi:hypothetical protein